MSADHETFGGHPVPVIRINIARSGTIDLERFGEREYLEWLYGVKYTDEEWAARQMRDDAYARALFGV